MVDSQPHAHVERYAHNDIPKQLEKVGLSTAADHPSSSGLMADDESTTQICPMLQREFEALVTHQLPLSPVLSHDPQLHNLLSLSSNNLSLQHFHSQ
ncbi:hypothetical protein ACH5RR_025969 [Cinchona calisaya]|uniref:Uncharacterized protein n=1 Tax=Cinchona calisaya TaxID=153742 RepID=A0ABD2Z169_9GENT